MYLVDRFDRILDVLQGWQRRHVIDACQLLGLDRSFKYHQGCMANLAALANACRSPAVARTRLFTWLVFNVLVGNSDAHLKNLSFLVSHEGIQLAPFYDQISVASYDTVAFDKQGWPQQTQFAWPILGIHRFSDISRNLLLQAGAALQLTQRTAERLLESLRGQIMQSAEALYAEFEAQNKTIVQTRPELSATLAGEARCVRTILHVIIKDMTKQIA